MRSPLIMKVSDWKAGKNFVLERLRGFEQQFSYFFNPQKMCGPMSVNKEIVRWVSVWAFIALKRVQNGNFWHFRPTLWALKTCLSFWITKLHFATQITELWLVHDLWGVNCSFSLGIWPIQFSHKGDIALLRTIRNRKCTQCLLGTPTRQAPPRWRPGASGQVEQWLLLPETASSSWAPGLALERKK